ncbi:MAG: heparan-alpha-glucosaminide N-acetyltransferase domain-containing protein [Saprospiraceae bacterium]|jgi:predicted acyltransferase|nr:DUF1624 domain-containing protein [Lewinellaceae bacterium]
MRYLSIDFYRGFTIALMLLVNTPGTWSQVYGPLLHADWHGCTPTDLVFPSFMFIIGVSMWFSFEKYGRTLSKAVSWKIIRRMAILFGLGLLLAAFPFYDKSLDNLRIMGVLQRIALGYGLAAFLVLTLPPRWLFGVAAIILLGYWALLVGMAPPLEDPFSLVHNYARQIDLSVLGSKHLWKGKGVPFDPEGLLSTLPAVVTVLLGWWSGQIMQKRQEQKRQAVRDLLFWGVIVATAGLVWDLAFPINKSLWTSSFVLYTGGLSMIFLAFSVWALDIVNGKRFAGFFLVFGANPLFAFVLAGLLTKTIVRIKWMEHDEPVNAYSWIYNTMFKPIDGGGPFGSLLFAVGFLLVIWAVCLPLYRRKIFIKI